MVLDDKFLHCPFCDCVFLTEHDLRVHLDCFGRKAVLHKRNFNRVHFDVEITYSREHGGADRSIARARWLILDYLEMCRASGKKVRALV